MQNPEQGGETGGSALLRILNGVALALIGASVLAQTLLGIQLLNNPWEVASPATLALGWLSMAIIPGNVLALAKLILNVIRSYREVGALRYVALYIAILALPFLLSGLIGKRLQASAEHAAQQQVQQPTQQDQSAQYVAGVEWAKQNNPVNRTACRGDFDFIRGCWQQVDDRINGQYKAGEDWARENKPLRAALCQGAPHFVIGCRTYFDEHLRPPRPDGLDKYTGMTSAECVEDVQGSIDAVRNVDAEDGDVQKFTNSYRRHWGPLLKECENYDETAAMQWMPSAYNRLITAIDVLKDGRTVNDAEHAAILKDFTAMAGVKSQPYTVSYMEKFNEYTQRKAGEFQDPVINYPAISCSEYQAKIDAMKVLDKQRSDAMNALRRPGGVVIDSPQYTQLNKDRIAMLGDWALYTDGAKKNHCQVAGQ